MGFARVKSELRRFWRFVKREGYPRDNEHGKLVSYHRQFGFQIPYVGIGGEKEYGEEREDTTRKFQQKLKLSFLGAKFSTSYGTKRGLCSLLSVNNVLKITR